MLKRQKVIDKVVPRRGNIYISSSIDEKLTLIESKEHLIEIFPVLKTKLKYDKNNHRQKSSNESGGSNVATINDENINGANVSENTSAALNECAWGESSTSVADTHNNQL